MIALRQAYDLQLMAIVGTLLTIGVPMVFSASHLIAYRDSGEATWYLQRQVVWVAIGLAALLICSRIPYRRWRSLSVPMMFGITAVLAATLVLGTFTFGARRWLLEGSFQPSELAKLITVIYVAHWLSSRRDKLQRISYGLIPFYVIVGGVAGFVIVQPDLSTSLILVMTALAMFFAAGAPIGQLIVSSLALSGVMAVMLISLVPWRMSRVLIVLDPLKDRTGEGYQIFQMLLAMSSGGLTGNGFSSLTSTIGYIPASHTDAIFAVIGNDFGLVGCSAVVILFALLARSGVQIAKAAPDLFGSLLALGITVWLIGQALMNVASTTASMPFTGVPLPFISFGGSAIATSLAAVGVLLSVSRSNHAEDRTVERRWGHAQLRKPARSSSV